MDFFFKYAGELYVQGTYDKHPGFDASATCEWHAMRDGLMAGRKQDSVRLRRPSRCYVSLAYRRSSTYTRAAGFDLFFCPCIEKNCFL